MAVALCNDPIDGEQPQAGAFVGFFGGKERLEDLLERSPGRFDSTSRASPPWALP